MWDIFIFAFEAVMPIIILILLGYFLKRINLINEHFAKVGNTFVFKVALPCLLFYNVYEIKSISNINWGVVGYAVGIIIILFFVGILYVKFFVKDDAKKGVLLQNVFRSNYAIIGISLAETLGGTEAVAIASIISAFSIPTFNILAVISLSIFVKDEDETLTTKQRLLNTLKKIATNPLIIGVLLGLLCLAVRSLLPSNSDGTPVFTLKENLPVIYTSIKNIKSIASPLALIVLGAGFTFSAVKGMKKEIISGVLTRLVIVPLITIGIAIIFSKNNVSGFDSTVFPAYVGLFASPVAVSSAIMAQQMKNDGKLAGQLVVWTTLVSVITLFIVIMILRGLALL